MNAVSACLTYVCTFVRVFFFFASESTQCPHDGFAARSWKLVGYPRHSLDFFMIFPRCCVRFTFSRS